MRITLSLVLVVILASLAFGTLTQPAHATQSTDELVVSGSQIVEVIVKDPTIQNTNQVFTEPSVTVHGNQLRMAQATDGYWYAFFADFHSALLADKTQYISSSIPSTGKGLDFGEFCSPTSAINATGVDFSQTEGVAIAQSAPGASNGDYNSNSYGVLSTCTGPADGSFKNLSGGSILNHVVRHPPSLNMMSGISGGKVGQIGINPNAWPVIQLVGNPTPIIYANTALVNLNTGSPPTSKILVDTDKISFPKQIALEIVNPSMRIDPTSKDSWTWSTTPSISSTDSNGNPVYTSGLKLYYQAFDENGQPDADGTIGMQNVAGNTVFTPLSNEQNGNYVKSQSNGFQTLNSDGSTKSIPSLLLPVTLLETNSTSGSFINFDSSNKANLIVPQSPPSGNVPRIFSFFTDQGPSQTGIIQFYHASTAYNNAYTTNENTPIPTVLQGRSYDNYPINYSIVASPQHGILMNVNHNNGSVVYLPNQDYVGNDVFLFKISNKFYDSNVGATSVTVNSVDFTPSAKVGSDQTVSAGSTVTLDGSGSIDPYYNSVMKYYANGQTQPIGNYLKYSWSQSSGIPVTLSDKTSPKPTFVAPSTANGIILPFTLTIADKGTSTSSPVTITVKQSSTQPIQNATTPNTNNTSPTPQPSSDSIKVSTTKPSYNYGEIIGITVGVGRINGTTPVTLSVLNPNTQLVSISQLIPNSNGTIYTKVLSTGPLWSQDGIYSIRVQYGPILKTQTTFSFISNGTSHANIQPSATSTPQTNQPTTTQSSTPAISSAVINASPSYTSDIVSAKSNQTIAAQIDVSNQTVQTQSYDNTVSVKTNKTSSDSLSLTVTAPSQTTPKVFLIDLGTTSVNVANLKDLGVMYDGKPIQPATDVESLLHAKSTDDPKYAIVVTQYGVQILVLVPHFSTHTITITNMSKVIPVIPEFPFSLFTLIIATFSIVLIPKMRQLI